MGKWLGVPAAMATILPTAWVCRNAAACRCKCSFSALPLCASSILPHLLAVRSWPGSLSQGADRGSDSAQGDGRWGLQF